MSLQTTKMASTSSASKGVKRKDTTEENENKKDDIKRSFQKEEPTKYAWLKYEDGEMYCSVCKAFKKKNTLTNFSASTLARHMGSCNRTSVCAADGNDDKEIFFQRRSISDSGTAHSLLHGETRYRTRQVSGLHRLPSDARVFVIECNHNWRSSQCFVPQSRHGDTICNPKSGYVTTKLRGTSTCRRNNNAIFSDRAVFTFPTGAVSQPR